MTLATKKTRMLRKRMLNETLRGLKPWLNIIKTNLNEDLTYEIEDGRLLRIFWF